MTTTASPAARAELANVARIDLAVATKVRDQFVTILANIENAPVVRGTFVLSWGIPNCFVGNDGQVRPMGRAKIFATGGAAARFVERTGIRNGHGSQPVPMLASKAKADALVAAREHVRLMNEACEAAL